MPTTTALALLSLTLVAGPPPEKLPDAPFVTTPLEVVDAMLRLAGTGPEDVVYDLGCGDGRIPIAAVRDFAARRAVCVELDRELLREARAKAREAGVEERMDFVEGDLYEVDLAPATVVTLYLFPSANLKLRPKLLRELAPGARVVSHHFDMGDWPPDTTVHPHGATLHLWTIPPPAPPAPAPPS